MFIISSINRLKSYEKVKLQLYNSLYCLCIIIPLHGKILHAKHAHIVVHIYHTSSQNYAGKWLKIEGFSNKTSGRSKKKSWPEFNFGKYQLEPSAIWYVSLTHA